jgi:hypothetical protein
MIENEKRGAFFYGGFGLLVHDHNAHGKMIFENRSRGKVQFHNFLFSGMRIPS